MSGWSCPHQTVDYFCQRVRRPCVPGMKGCVLRGKVHFAKEEDTDPASQAVPDPDTARNRGRARRGKAGKG